MVDLLESAGGRQDSQAFVKQEVAAVAIGNAFYVAGVAEFINIFDQ